MNRFIIFSAVMLFIAACSGKAVQPPPVAEDAVSLRLDNISIVDPRDGGITANMSIIIENGVISDTVPTGEVSDEVSGIVIDATGNYAVPGYNNMHMHVLTDAENRDQLLARMLAEGVTGIRQMSGTAKLLKAVSEDEFHIELGPRLLAMPGEVMTPFNANSVGAAEKEVESQSHAGADFIKIGLVDRQTFFAILNKAQKLKLPTAGHLPSDVTLVQAAEAGFGSTEHFGTGNNIWFDCSSDPESYYQAPANASRLPGVFANAPLAQQIAQGRLKKILINPSAFTDPRSVELRKHALEDYDAKACAFQASQLAELGGWQVPTLVRLRTQELADAKEYEQDAALQYMSEEAVERWREVTGVFAALPKEVRDTYRRSYNMRLDVIGIWDEHGVPMMTGTDGGGSVPGQSLQQEFQELSKAGLSPLKILQMTTILPAKFLGQQGQMGLIEPGMAADIVVLEADPTKEVDNLANISAVIRSGRYFDSSELQALIVTLGPNGGDDD